MQQLNPTMHFSFGGGNMIPDVSMNSPAPRQFLHFRQVWLTTQDKM